MLGSVLGGARSGRPMQLATAETIEATYLGSRAWVVAITRQSSASPIAGTFASVSMSHKRVLGPGRKPIFGGRRKVVLLSVGKRLRPGTIRWRMRYRRAPAPHPPRPGRSGGRFRRAGRASYFSRRSTRASDIRRHRQADDKAGELGNSVVVRRGMERGKPLQPIDMRGEESEDRLTALLIEALRRQPWRWPAPQK